jgi:signal transduction histidine kinase
MLETQAPPLHFEPFSLTELVQDVVQKFKLEAERKTLDLGVELPESAAFVSGDIGLIERVLENLIENAIKYTPKGGSVALALDAGPERIVTSVSDSGRGIEEADLPHIFERFYRAAKHRSGEPEGTGLGLAIAKRIRGHRPGPGHRQADLAVARQSDPGGESAGRRYPVQLSAPGGERQIERRSIPNPVS